MPISIQPSAVRRKCARTGIDQVSCPGAVEVTPTPTMLPAGSGNVPGACAACPDAAVVSPSGMVVPALLSRLHQVRRYSDGSGATPARAAALSNDSTPAGVSAKFTSGLIAGRYAAAILSRRLI